MHPSSRISFFFFFNDTATTEIYTLSLHDALPILFVEAAIRRLYGFGQRSSDSEKTQVSGWGNVSLILTGQLGDVMKESARAALTFAATHASTLQIPEDRLGSIEVHLHVPAGGNSEGRSPA